MIEPGFDRVADPAKEAATKGGVRVRRRAVEAFQHECSDAGPALDEALVFQLAVGLEHRVWVDRDGAHHFFHGWKLVSAAEHPEAERMLHLLDDLKVGSDPGAGLEPKLDHVLIPYLSRMIDKVPRASFMSRHRHGRSWSRSEDLGCRARDRVG